jgi:hypothetical protein
MGSTQTTAAELDAMFAGRYNPVSGERYTVEEARAEWSQSMTSASTGGRASGWNLRGATPAEFYWSFFNFRSYTGRVTIEADGFHWSTQAYDNRAGDEIYHEGITTSLYEAYQSVTRNCPVTWAPAS